MYKICSGGLQKGPNLLPTEDITFPGFLYYLLASANEVAGRKYFQSYVSVSLSVHKGLSCYPWCIGPHHARRPSPLDMSKLVQLGPHCTGTSHTVGKFSCLTLLLPFVSLINRRYSYQLPFDCHVILHFLYPVVSRRGLQWYIELCWKTAKKEMNLVACAIWTRLMSISLWRTMKENTGYLALVCGLYSEE